MRQPAHPKKVVPGMRVLKFYQRADKNRIQLVL